MPILTLHNLNKTLTSLRTQNKSIVLTGGCFDILHLGHIRFLEKAKKEGGILLVMLESDEQIRKLKGTGRPVHTQKERAEILSSLRSIDYVLLLPGQMQNQDYDLLVKKIKPAIIALTKGDSTVEHKKRQAKLTGAKLRYVTPRIPDKSTSTIAQNLYKEKL